MTNNMKYDKTTLIYDSVYGNTKKIAEAIIKGLTGEVVIKKPGDVDPSELQGLGVLLVGSPTHGGRASKPMQKFLDNIPSHALKNIRAAAFDTCMPIKGQKFFLKLIINLFGYAAKRIAKVLQSKGATIIATESFFVLGKKGPLKKGEEARAKEWAQKIKSLYH